jgi:hypothetical protein
MSMRMSLEKQIIGYPFIGHGFRSEEPHISDRHTALRNANADDNSRPDSSTSPSPSPGEAPDATPRPKSLGTRLTPLAAPNLVLGMALLGWGAWLGT